MFTGIVDAKGIVESTGRRLVVQTPYADLVDGESISLNGVCLTVAQVGDAGRIEADLSDETLERSNLGLLRPRDSVNLERAMRMGDRFGGHVVQGHVDGIARISKLDRVETGIEMTVEPHDVRLLAYVVEKGSITIDGVSLTATNVDGDSVVVALIPHTLSVTNLGDRGVGDTVNVEVDILAKYVEKLLGARTN